MLYDAGVTALSKGAMEAIDCELRTSIVPRQSKNDTLSYSRRTEISTMSSMRIRVEKFICINIVKQRFHILAKILPLADLGMMDDIFYCCCRLSSDWDFLQFAARVLRCEFA
jgi:hypothetical protein